MKSFNVSKLKNELEKNFYQHKDFIDGITAHKQDMLINECFSNRCKDMAKSEIKIFNSIEERLIAVHKSYLEIFEEVINANDLNKYVQLIKLTKKLLKSGQYNSEMLEKIYKRGYSRVTLERYRDNVSESIKQMERFILIDGEFISIETSLVSEIDKDEKEFLMLHIKNK
jgi:predicted RNA-binding protein with EMAP domain